MGFSLRVQIKFIVFGSNIIKRSSGVLPVG